MANSAPKTHRFSDDAARVSGAGVPSQLKEVYDIVRQNAASAVALRSKFLHAATAVIEDLETSFDGKDPVGRAQAALELLTGDVRQLIKEAEQAGGIGPTDLTEPVGQKRHVDQLADIRLAALATLTLLRRGLTAAEGGPPIIDAEIVDAPHSASDDG